MYEMLILMRFLTIFFRIQRTYHVGNYPACICVARGKAISCGIDICQKIQDLSKLTFFQKTYPTNVVLHSSLTGILYTAAIW